MSFFEFLPAAGWRDHIAAYWVRKTEVDACIAGRRVYANGCADVICNAGDSIVYFHPLGGEMVIPLYPGRLYLAGTMTAYGVIKSEPGSLLTGIRFWPGGFYALFAQSMTPAVDSLIEFPEEELCVLMQREDGMAAGLDRWFGERPARPADGIDFAFLRKLMYDSGGMVSVEALAKEMHVSNRTLERIFKQNVGMTPKEFLRIIRFQEVLQRLRKAPANESLLRTAYDLGYYDHAHLTNEFKKYAGIVPSELSHFYKTGISDGQYF